MSFSSRTSSSKGTVNADVKADKSPSKRSAPTQNSDEDEEKASVSSVKKAKNDIISSPAVDSKGLKIKLNQPTAKKNEPEKLKKTCVFGESSDEDEVEEMPPEAKMRMKNIGRDTQTSAGPNSFGKTRQGFCDSSKIFERQLKKVLDESK